MGQAIGLAIWRGSSCLTLFEIPAEYLLYIPFFFFFLGITLANWFEKGEKIHLSVVFVTDIVNSEYAKTFESSVTKIKGV